MDENFKRHYKNIIETVKTDFALLLKFEQKYYFSLFGIEFQKAVEINDSIAFCFLFPFELDMINEKDEKSSHKIKIIFGGFVYKSLVVKEYKSETLLLVGESEQNYFGRKELILKY